MSISTLISNQKSLKLLSVVCHSLLFMLCYTMLSSSSFANETWFNFDPNATCGDFLRQYDPDAPDYFQYQRCDELDDRQAKPIEVLYKVEGKYAKEAETYLMEKTGIGKLKFICCYWGSENGQRGSFNHPQTGLYHEVIFSSEETSSNVDWQDVTFYLSISVYREDI